MAVYEGKQGIASLREKIKLKSKMLVGESLEKIAVTLVDESVEVVDVSKYEGFGEACMWRILCVSV